MAEAGFSEKTEPATGKRRGEVREEGQVAKSVDLNTALSLLVACGLLWAFGGIIWRILCGVTVRCLRDCGERDFSAFSDLNHLFFFLAVEMMKILLPVMGVMFLTSVVTNAMQVGLVWSTKRFGFGFGFGGFNPINGVKRMFSSRSVFRMVVGFVKLLFIGTGLYWVLSRRLDGILGVIWMPIPMIFDYASGLTLRMAVTVALLLLFLALIDYSYQRWTFERDIRMTKQEIKDEMKDLEGDPKIKARRLRVMRQLAMQRMMQGVPKADVVITNPTHYAIALEYKMGVHEAPKVLAKGTDNLALRIRKVAQEHRIPIVERPDLARALYAQVEVGDTVPQDFWQAVAEVLTYVHQLSGHLEGATA